MTPINHILLNTVMQEGFIILMVGLLTVFGALVSLYLVFGFLVPKAIALLFDKKTPVTSPGEITRKEHVSGEEIAAASAAVYLFLNEIHDEENAILTIHQSVKEYSPWSSKIYGTHYMGKRQ